MEFMISTMFYQVLIVNPMGRILVAPAIFWEIISRSVPPYLHLVACEQVCCSVLLCGAQCCSVRGTHCNTLKRLAHCKTLQHTAAHCNTLQHTATHYNALQHSTTRLVL